MSTIPAKSRLLTAMPMMLRRTKRTWKNSSLPSDIADSVPELFAGELVKKEEEETLGHLHVGDGEQPSSWSVPILK